MTENEFKFCIGQTIMLCQCIEHDIKLIYAGTQIGTLEANLQLIQKNTLGETIKFLQDSDSLKQKPFFSYNDYKLLKQITHIRNYWVHQGFIDYVYQSPNKINEKFNEQFERLLEDKDKLEYLHKATEKIRLELFNKKK